MKALLRRAWLAIFPIPNVSQLEAFLLRAFLVATVLRFLPPSIGESSQPVPVGLAHFFNLTWLSNPQAYQVFHFAVMALGLLYASGAALHLTLPALTVLQVLPYTLLNSQGHSHHSYQIISAALLGMAVLAIAQKVRGQGQPMPSLRQWALLAVLIAVGMAVLEWFLVKGGGDAFAKGMGSLFGPFVGDYSFSFGRFALVTLVSWPLAKIAAGRDQLGLPSAVLNASMLMAGQFMIAGAYLVSVCSKMIISKGMWLLHSQYVALDFVKTMRQSYYSTLDPKFAHDPAGVQFLMSHENLARMFFGGGVVLEAVLIFAVGTRWLSLGFGVLLVLMHATIKELMTLSFPTNEIMDTLFFVNAPFLIALVVLKFRGKQEHSMSNR